MSTPTLEVPPPELLGKAVGDLLVRRPKTLPCDTTVAQARACFADDHVHMLLLTKRGRLLGTLVRTDLRAEYGDTDLALTYSRLSGRTVAVDLPAETARKFLMALGQRRLAVMDEGGMLVGLLCLKSRLTGFCGATDIASRAAERTARSK